MRKTIIIAALVLTTAVSCNKTPNSPFAKKVADYALVTLETPDLSGITDNGKEVLNLYRFIADEVDAIYWEQYFGNKNALLDGLTDPAQKEFAQINYGPWDNGNLETVWYHDAYKEHIDKIANYLKAAADITIKPSVKEYLLSKAQALQTDNYYESSIKWLDMDDSKMDLVVGPNEAADDQLLGVKRSYEAFVLLKNEARTNELMKYVSRIEEFQQDLPGDAAYKTFQPGTGSNIFSCNALYYAGKANAGVKVIALNLPFDADVQRDRGTRTILLENIINASVEDALGSAAITFEEIKANAAGILLVSKLQNHYDIRKLFTKEDALTTFFVSLVRSERFGEGSALGRANIIIYNYLEEAGAFQRKESGKYSLDYAKMESALSDLTALVLKTQATGDKAFATYFENCYSKRSENYDADLMNLALEKIPADIRFK